MIQPQSVSTRLRTSQSRPETHLLCTSVTVDMPPAQKGVQIVEEVKAIIENYKTIIKWVERLDPLDEPHKSQHTLNLISTLSKRYIPALQSFVKSSPLIRSDHRRTCLDEISALQQRTATPGEVSANNMSHESPLVHLLYLAIEKRKIPFSREQQPKEQNWGRLGAFPDYLRELEFKSLGHGTPERYWPGVPTCLMISVPVWTSGAEYRVSISASPDKFKHAEGLLRICWDHRKDRLKKLEASCRGDALVGIRSLRGFSKDLLNPVRWESLFKDLKEIEFNWTQSNLKPDNRVPVYLPVIISTWNPAGEYLPACGLDRLRFSILRPPEAEKKEQWSRQKAFKSTDTMPTADSCAEWDGFVDFISRPEHQEISWY